MNPPVSATLYRLDTNGEFEPEILHLYEHMVVRGIIRLWANAGFDYKFDGWLSARSYKQTVFVDATTYDARMKEALDNYMFGSSPKIDLQDIDHELKLLEAESQVLFDIPSKEHLISALQNLDRKQWIDVEQSDSPAIFATTNTVPSTLLPYRRSAKSFRNIAVGLYIENITPNEMALLSRVCGVLQSLVYLTMSDLHAYEQDAEELFVGHNGWGGTGATYTIRRGTYTSAQVRHEIEKALSNLSAHDWKNMKARFDAFREDIYYSEVMLDTFENTGLLVSRRQISKLATPENVESLFRRLSVRVVSIN